MKLMVVMKIENRVDLQWALTQSEGMIINMRSDNGRHIVHKLPLLRSCNAAKMFQDLEYDKSDYPKYYVVDACFLEILGNKDTDWKYCGHCGSHMEIVTEN
jgi:hypothetical protein